MSSNRTIGLAVSHQTETSVGSRQGSPSVIALILLMENARFPHSLVKALYKTSTTALANWLGHSRPKGCTSGSFGGLLTHTFHKQAPVRSTLDSSLILNV